MTTADDDQTPLLRVINPDATPEEIAALVAVFAFLGSATDGAPKLHRPAWSRPARGVRRTGDAAHRTGADGWRASGLPH